LISPVPDFYIVISRHNPPNIDMLAMLPIGSNSEKKIE
jgi:hypothetical protein